MKLFSAEISKINLSWQVEMNDSKLSSHCEISATKTSAPHLSGTCTMLSSHTFDMFVKWMNVLRSIRWMNISSPPWLPQWLADESKYSPCSLPPPALSLCPQCPQAQPSPTATTQCHLQHGRKGLILTFTCQVRRQHPPWPPTGQWGLIKTSTLRLWGLLCFNFVSLLNYIFTYKL